MPRLWGAVAIVTAVAALGIAPAVAQATVTSSTISTWTSSEPGTPQNASYLISYDNKGTTLTVTGLTNGGPGDHVDVVCFYGDAPSQYSILASELPVQRDQTFTTTPLGSTAPALKSIAGHACRLRAIPSGAENSTPSDDSPQFAGPNIAVSEVGLPSGLLDGLYPYDFYVVAATFAGYAAWDSAGSCGPYAAPFDSSYGQGNFALNCTGSLLGSANLPLLGGRSEVQVDGRNAYDAASAQSVFGGTENGPTLPPVGTSVLQDPTDGRITSQSTEGWVVCPHAIAYPPTFGTCPQFTGAGVQLQRDIATSDGGLVVTMTDTWSSTDGQAHSLDLLYDDYVGLKSSNAERGYEFPGQNAFSPYQAGATLPGPAAAPGSILLRTNLAAPDGDPSEAAGAITFSAAPAGFTFVSNSEFEEHQVLEVPAGGSASLSYTYSTGYTVGQVEGRALTAQDGFQPPAIAITSPADGATVSNPSVELTGTAGAGSGLASLSVAGQSVPVGQGGAWSADVPLSPGANTIAAVATDRAGASFEAQVTVVYAPPAPPPPGLVCRVPRIKGMKLPAAERALRRAHCRVGRIRRQRSKKARKGRVFDTSPRPGRVMRAGSKVELFVSKGR